MGLVPSRGAQPPLITAFLVWNAILGLGALPLPLPKASVGPWSGLHRVWGTWLLAGRVLVAGRVLRQGSPRRAVC